MSEVLKIYQVRQGCTIPTFGTPQSACFDVYSCLHDEDELVGYNAKCEKIQKNVCNSNVEIYPDDRVLIPTGIIFDIPSGYSMRLHPRSGLSLKNGIVLANHEAIIDEDYVEETMIMLHNISNKVFTVEHGMRLCQGELVKNVAVKFEVTLSRPEQTDRTGGFGSTGTN